jgi:hypothetical protein
MSDCENGTRRPNGISRSASLNETRNNKGIRPTQDQGGVNIAASTISFTNPNTISDSANGLGVFTFVGQEFTVFGSASNDRRFIVLTTGASSITVEPSQVTTESAGALILLRSS